MKGNIMRNWTWKTTEAETESETARAVRTVRVAALAREWNQIERNLDLRSLLREQDDDGDGGDDEVADTDCEDIWEARIEACRGDAQTACDRCLRACRRPPFQEFRAPCDRLSAEQIEALVEASFEAIEDRQRSEDERPLIEQGLIEEQLAALGARMMRPYEHHGEDEAYYEYAENSAY